MPKSLSDDNVRELPVALTVSQAAGMLRISRSTAYQAIHEGRWPTRVVRVGRSIRVPKVDVLGLLGLAEDGDAPGEGTGAAAPNLNRTTPAGAA